MLLSKSIRVDKQYSARADYRWFRACGFTRSWCVAAILYRYGWFGSYPKPRGL